MKTLIQKIFELSKDKIKESSKIDTSRKWKHSVKFSFKIHDIIDIFKKKR